MKLKQELGKRIVADFHGREAAEHAAQDWSRMFQKDETPDDLPLVTVKFAEVAAPMRPLRRMAWSRSASTSCSPRRASPPPSPTAPQSETERGEDRWRVEERPRRVGEAGFRVHAARGEEDGENEGGVVRFLCDFGQSAQASEPKLKGA